MSHHPDVVMGARLSLSLIYKKAHRWEDAARLWQDLVAADPHDVFAVEELARLLPVRTGEILPSFHQGLK